MWWRASADNVAHLDHIADLLAAQKQTETAAGLHQIGAQMQAARAHGDHYWVNRRAQVVVTADDRADNLPTDPPAFAKPVYVIVPGQCATPASTRLIISRCSRT